MAGGVGNVEASEFEHMFEHLLERTLSKTSVFHGQIIQVEQWQVGLPNGAEAVREIVLHPGAVAILAEPESDKVVLVEQFRAATGEVLLEIPAGKLGVGESPETCALRELVEETGYSSTSLQKLNEFYTSPGFADERIHLFHATGLLPGSTQLDEDEFVDVRTYDRREIGSLLDEGRIRDAKTLVALLWWQLTKQSERT